MLRYLSLVWNPAHAQESRAARHLARSIQVARPLWRFAVDKDGLVVAYSSTGPVAEQVYLLDGGNGVVLGVLYEHSYEAGSVPRPVTLDEARTSRILASQGSEIVERYWGQYVAFVRHPQTATVSIVRDPSGGILCFKTSVANVDVYFSRQTDVNALGNANFTVNWRYIAGQLVLGDVQNGETGLQEVSQVLPGECIQKSYTDNARHFYWNPLRISSSDIIEEPQEAIAKTRNVVRACVHAWASRHRRLVHFLSGGLDSSIILSCLRDAPTGPHVTCLNLRSGGSDGDERRYARPAAARAGCELVEWERQAACSLAPLLALPRTPFPSSCFQHLEIGARENSLAMDRGATALFYGVGGDWLFFRGGDLPASVDYAYRHGLGHRLFQRVLDSCHLQHFSFWQVLRLTLGYGALKRKWRLSDADLLSRSRPLLAEGLSARVIADKSFDHPLYKDASGIPPVKLAHAEMITSGSMLKHNPLETESDPHRVSPLCSQPFMELSLRIPVDVLTIGGRDRSIARLAFKYDMPSLITNRSSKGGVEPLIKAIVMNNLPIARDLLMDGALVKQGFVNRTALKIALAGEFGRANIQPEEISILLTLEAWCHSWSSDAARAAA